MTGKEERIALAVPSWRNQARCRNVPEEELNAFFPWTSGESDRAEPSDIRKVTETYCKGCPVRDECLDFAVNFGCQGIWGGVYISYRKAIRLQNMEVKPKTRQEIKDLLKSSDGVDDE